jgi:hypothetical protein
MAIVFALCTQLLLADSLYAHGYLEAARVEYLRGFLFYPELKLEIGPRLNYAVSLLAVNEPEGIAELNGIVNDFPELQTDIIEKIAAQYIRVGRYYLAINLLSNAEDKKVLGLAYLLDDQLLQARNAFLQNEDYAIAADIDSYIRMPVKSEKTALLLSLFLPGSGQVYASDIRQGFMDFLINVGSGYLFYNALKQQKYVDASLIFFFLINRFYLGSLHNAQKSAQEYNEKQRKAWLDAFLQTRFDSFRIETH